MEMDKEEYKFELSRRQTLGIIIVVVVLFSIIGLGIRIKMWGMP